MGGGGKSSPAPQQDNSGMMQMIAQQNAMQQQFMAQQAQAQREAAAAAKLAQDTAIYNTQVQSANQASQTGANAAQQQLGLQGQYQQAKDSAKSAEALRQAEAAGTSATGGGYDIGAAQKSQYANLGAAAGTLPKTASNLAGNMSAVKNPAATTAGSATQAANKGVTGSNQFTLPSSMGLTFGGQ